jgi:transcriptional regulator with XRE-family HTH domain
MMRNEMPTPSERAGATVRDLRTRAGLSALELSRRSGVARGTLAQLESGTGNPTVETLYALADALGVPLADLLADEPPATEVRVVRTGEGPEVHGAALDATLLERLERPGVTGELYAIRFAAGAVRRAQPHPFGVVEHLHLHSGRARVGPADAPVELGPGDYARFDGSVPHSYEALGGEAAGTLLILTPDPRRR